MFNLVKPGHILRFGVDPSTIISPPGVSGSSNDNTLLTPWPMASNLGTVQCLSHPSGPIGKIAAAVATGARTTSGGISRAASYSAAGQFLTASNRVIGSVPADFVGYVDGQTNYILSTQTVFSKDFSGCLMAVYTVNGQRHVAHVAASSVAHMNCKQSFLTKIQGMNNTVLNGWFRPFVAVDDVGRKLDAFALIKSYIANQIDNLTTFGVVASTGQAYAIDAFKPKGIVGNDWVVTDVRAKTMSQSHTAPVVQ